MQREEAGHRSPSEKAKEHGRDRAQALEPESSVQISIPPPPTWGLGGKALIIPGPLTGGPTCHLAAKLGALNV